MSPLPVAATAAEFDSHDAQYVASTPCQFELAETEELCGWAELGTHDSAPLPAAAPATTAIGSDLPVDASITAIAATACASAGVSVEQIVEPFAMVGPFLDDSFASVEQFQSWWAAAIAEARSLHERDAASKSEPAVNIQDELDAIAAQEPIDIESIDVQPIAPMNLEGLGPSVLVEEFPPADEPDRIEVTAVNPLIGGSPIIATIEETYLPYDLAARDMHLWSVFPVPTHPFCIRSHAYTSPLWEEFDEITRVDQIAPVATGDAYVQCGSADCHLADLIWRVESWTADDSQVWTAIKPRNIGHRFAKLAVSGNRLVGDAAQLLASRWPEVKQRVAPSPAGEALLARAGATEASEIQVPENQIAEAPTESNLR